jgi:hypothetical protein
MFEQLLFYIRQIRQQGVNLTFNDVAKSNTPKDNDYYKRCNMLAVEAFRALEKEIKMSQLK